MTWERDPEWTPGQDEPIDYCYGCRESSWDGRFTKANPCACVRGEYPGDGKPPGFDSPEHMVAAALGIVDSIRTRAADFGPDVARALEREINVHHSTRMTTAAGKAVGIHEIRLSWPVFRDPENVRDFRATVIHELAHIVANRAVLKIAGYRAYVTLRACDVMGAGPGMVALPVEATRKPGHGRLWQAIDRAFGGTGRVYHDLRVAKRRVKRWAGTCRKCGTRVLVTRGMFTKATSGRARCVHRCGGQVLFSDVDPVMVER